MVTVDQPKDVHRNSSTQGGTGAVEAHCEITGVIILYRNDTLHERGGKFFMGGLSASGHSRQATLCAIDVLLQKLERIGRLKSVPTTSTRGISLTT